MTTEQQAKHDNLANIRNKSIAHLDTDGPIEDRSYDEDVLIVVHDPLVGHRFDVACSRLIFQADLEDDVRALVGAAIEAGWEIIRKRAAQAAEKLRDASRVEPEIGQMIQKYPFDAVRFFGSEEIADAFLRQSIFRKPGDDEFDQVIFEGWPSTKGR
tara:strand:+ start:736 stop:1206 length:471 start_codon:yes stop_codon:yes gene_type:complete